MPIDATIYGQQQSLHHMSNGVNGRAFENIPLTSIAI